MNTYDLEYEKHMTLGSQVWVPRQVQGCPAAGTPRGPERRAPIHLGFPRLASEGLEMLDNTHIPLD